MVAIPPLVGGLVSALIMSEGAAAAGLPTLAVFAIVIYVVQGFAGYPLTSIMLKKEGQNLLAKYRKNELTAKQLPGEQKGTTGKAVKEPRMFANMPDKYNTDFFKFFRLALVGYLAYLTSVLAAPIVEISHLCYVCYSVSSAAASDSWNATRCRKQTDSDLRSWGCCFIFSTA